MAQSKDEYIDISGLDKVNLLQHLWENTGPRFPTSEEPVIVKAIWHQPRMPFRSEKALRVVDKYIDYYEARPIKCDLSGDKAESRFYDRDSHRPMRKIVEEMRNEKSSLSDLPDKEIAQWELCTQEFFYSLCLTCYKISSLKCAGCGLVAYCSKDCMKTGRADHKELCEAISKAQGKNTTNFAATLSSPQVLQDTWLKVEELLGRPLKYFEMEILTRPKVCNFCNSAEHNKLMDCTRCRCVSYCSTKHSQNDYKEHQLICEELRRAIQAYKYLRCCTRNRELFPTGIDKEYVPLLGNELENKKFKSLEGNLEDDDLLNNRKGIEKELGIMSDRASFMLIAMYVLQEYWLKNEISEATSLSLEILPQDFNLDFSVWEFFMHRLPKLKRLSLNFIGRNSQNGKGVDRKKGFPSSKKLCSDCQKHNRELKISCWFGNYHEYYSSEDYKDPDLIINYNSLFHHEAEEGSVKDYKCISNMTRDEDTLMLVTSPWITCLEEEMEFIKDLFEDQDDQSLDFLVEPTENPYRSHKPTRGPPGAKKCVRYENHYYMVFQKNDNEGKDKSMKGNKNSKKSKSTGKKGRRKD